jgi:POT family proton-dependent oligopeptide transporter
MIMGVAATLSGYFSNLALGNTQSLDPLVTNTGYSYTFGLLGLAAIGAGLLLFICVPLVLRLTHEKKLVGNIQRISSIGL